MDPVQSDLALLGVKPEESGVYNIHTPPLPSTGEGIRFYTCIPFVIFLFSFKEMVI